MFEQLKSLTRDSAVYGIGHIATRLITFLLLPYYSFQFTPAQYGEVTLYFLFVAVAQTFFIYGLDIAYLRYFTLCKDTAQRRIITGTAFLASVLTSLVFAALVIAFADSIGGILIKQPTQPDHVPALLRICGGILFFDTLTTFPFLLLRGTLRPYYFAAVKVVNVLINIGLNIWFIGALRLSLTGVLLANLAASGVTFGILLPVLLRYMTFRIDRATLTEMIRFGLPNIPTYLFVMVIELADRKVMEFYRGLEEAGLYSAGYKLGMFMAVVTGAFRFAWQPFFLSNADREDAPRLFARVLTYYVLVTVCLFIPLTFFIDAVIQTRWPGIGFILDARYWPGLAVFPIIMLAHIFDGIYANLMVGVYIKKLTHWLPLVTGTAAGVTIALDLALIPRYGMLSAAWITLAAFTIEALMLWLIVRRVYPVPYEWGRLAKLALAGGIVVSAGLQPALSQFWIRLLLCGAFPVLLFGLRFFDEREVYHLRKLLRRA